MFRILFVIFITLATSQAHALGKWKGINDLSKAELKDINLDFSLKGSCKKSSRYRAHKTIDGGKRFTIDPADNIWGPCKTDLPENANPKGRGSERMEVASSKYSGEFIFTARYKFHEPITAKRIAFFQLHAGESNVAPPTWFGLNNHGCFIEAHQGRFSDCERAPLEFELHVHWKTGKDGFLKYEVDGKTALRRIESDWAKSPYIKFGMYAVGVVDKHTLDITDVKLQRVIRD